MMTKRLLLLPLLAAAIFLALSMRAPIARAQIDPFDQSYGLYQRDQLVGEVFREDTNPSSYTEHWILYPAYVYPNDTNGVTVVIRPSGLRYAGTADFLTRAFWSTGSRYVKTACTDGTTLPTRR